MEPVFYRRADAEACLSAFQPLRREGATRVAALVQPLLIQTPTVTLASPLQHGDEQEVTTHAHLALPSAFGQFVAEVEALALQAALTHKAEWFSTDVDDDTLVAAFRELLKPSGHLKVHLDPEVSVFDPEGGLLARTDVHPGQAIRCILRLDQITFGRTEFAAEWSLHQAQVRPAPAPAQRAPRCLISAEDDDTPSE